MHIARLPNPVSPPVDTGASAKDQRKQLQQQEEAQRSNLERALQLHLDNSSPDAAPSSGKHAANGQRCHLLPAVLTGCCTGTMIRMQGTLCLPFLDLLCVISIITCTSL